MKKGFWAIALIFMGNFMPVSGRGEEKLDAEWKKEVDRKLDILAREKNTVEITGPGKGLYEGVHGLAPAASKVYHVPKGVSLGGYGEMIYHNVQSQKDDGTSSGKKDTIDFVRNILYVGFKYSDRILFNSEIEFEHASTTNQGSRGEVSVEFAALDFSLLQNEEKGTLLGVRTGLMLLPIGLRNELHEPTLFHGTARPKTESNIIPSTWRDNGVGVFGRLGPVEYRSYVTAGLQGVNEKGGFGGFTSSGLRGGRSKGSKSQAEDKALSARVDYAGLPGTLIGGSFYTGDSGQDTKNAAGKEIEGKVNLYEVHIETEFKGAELTALYSRATVDDVADLNAAQLDSDDGSSKPLTGSSSIGEEMFGGYIELAFDIFSLFDTDHYLAPFYRYERTDTQQGVPAGFTEDPATDKTYHTFGLSYKPHPNVVIKADVQNENNKAGTGIDAGSLGIGFLY